MNLCQIYVKREFETVLGKLNANQDARSSYLTSTQSLGGNKKGPNNSFLKLKRPCASLKFKTSGINLAWPKRSLTITLQCRGYYRKNYNY